MKTANIPPESQNTESSQPMSVKNPPNETQLITKKSFLKRYKYWISISVILTVALIITIPLVIVEVQKSEESKSKSYQKIIKDYNGSISIQVGGTKEGKHYVLADFSTSNSRMLETSESEQTEGKKEACQNIILSDDNENEVRVVSKCGGDDQWRQVNQDTSNSTNITELRIETSDEKDQLNDHSFISAQEVQSQASSKNGLANRILISTDTWEEKTFCGGTVKQKRVRQEAKLCYPKFKCHRWRCSVHWDCNVVTLFSFHLSPTCLKPCPRLKCSYDLFVCINLSDCSCYYASCPYGYQYPGDYCTCKQPPNY